ncbi:10K-L protein [Providencia rustigianii]|uniref:HdeA/HdeB family chaperone n=1 Tax=Providencia TaxID=586 RepID=UPI000D9DBA9E|nr:MULTISPECIES: HdeA/HdeB family chaperone [Providencia]MTC55208.1 ABC transporter substrate-binding protein [Providencia rustigianii]SPY78155.1 10K-L protein [Providencia rustigianii]VEB71464.1 10K-L protein [Providencia rustigianii]
MNKFIISACMIASSALSFNALAADKMTSTPENMTCKEYVDLNPKSWAPVALWVTSQDTQFKSGDWVALSEQSVAEAPLILEFCKKKPEGTLKDYLASKK